jgi:uncharacterized membrane protein YraQ (UPF0718 family)
MSEIQQYLDALWHLSLEAAPWLLLGLIIGGLFKSLVPQAFLQKHLTQPGLGSITKAAVLGMPLPLCSCGVIPAAMGLRQAGASKPATSSFLVATPETGVDSISVTYAMMGPVMAVIRPVAALISAVVTGLLVWLLGDEQREQPEATVSSCCGSANQAATAKASAGWLRDAVSGIWYALTDLYQSLLKWLIIGLALAALIDAFVPHDWLLRWGDSWLVMVLMLFVGIPMYVCATGSTPIAAGFLMAGISPGAVLVFLLAGPATNMATLGVIRDHMGARTMWLYLTGIISCSLVLGIMVNVMFTPEQVTGTAAHAHDLLPGFLKISSLIVLVLLALLPLWPIDKTDTGGCCEGESSCSSNT